LVDATVVTSDMWICQGAGLPQAWIDGLLATGGSLLYTLLMNMLYASEQFEK
jgi:hypothetical protein